MALIKCNNCGRSVSDRATVCPHCGCDPHTTKNANAETNSPNTNLENEQNSNLTTCPHCGALVSKKADVCPKCGKPTIVNSNQSQNIVEGDNSDVDEYEYAEEKTANHGLLSIVGILTIIAFVFAGFLYSGNRYYKGKTFKFIIDTCAVDTDFVDTCAVDTAPPYLDYSVPDSAYYDGPESYAQPEKEEVPGFKSNSDVMDFVVGNSYSHDGITLRITDEAVYANDNKISTSKPVFRKLTLNKGVITARPSISITVIRDDNRLVDNNNGDSYYY